MDSAAARGLPEERHQTFQNPADQRVGRKRPEIYREGHRVRQGPVVSSSRRDAGVQNVPDDPFCAQRVPIHIQVHAEQVGLLGSLLVHGAEMQGSTYVLAQDDRGDESQKS